MTRTCAPLRPVPEPVPLLREVLGETIREERHALERTLRDVAKDAQVSIAHLSEIERGRNEASSEIISAVCGALGITVGSLIASAADSLAEHEARLAQATPASCTVAMAA